MPEEECACGAGCPAGACAAAAATECACGAAGFFGVHDRHYRMTPEQRERERQVVKELNDHVEEHAVELAKRHFTYKGWTLTPYVSYSEGFAEIRWRAKKKNDKSFKGENYGEVKLRILRYVDAPKWLHMLERRI